jgi:Zn-dependent peptidase ImmA (M78 family)
MIVADKAKKLIKRCKTNNPFDICNTIGIEIVYADIGSLKGMYTCIKRNRFIVINQNLNIHMKRMVCAHELAHDQLHRTVSSSSWIKDSDLYLSDTKREHEANIFVAELLVDESSLIELIHQKKSINEIAKILFVDPTLVSLKVRLLIEKGYDYIPQEYDSKFLK